VGHKILLADDSVTVQKIITLTFSDEGVDVVTVDNGDEAISRLQYLRPALVMADVAIPGRNGYEICEFVKLHPEMSDTPVILLVPAFEPFDEERARRIGADYHLTKPFQSIRTLISTVKNLMERKEGPELSIEGSGLTAVRDFNSTDSGGAEPDPKRAKIEELIKLSAQGPPSTLEYVADDDPLMEIDLAQGNGLRPAALPAISAPEPIEADLVEVTEVLDENMDNILELEDLMPEVSSEWVIPQSVIDEIVNRVSAQLSERLSGEIARRIAPEVVELVRRQFLVQPSVFRDSDNLLDLD
jgi:CheY-like chemotaxis protein